MFLDSSTCTILKKYPGYSTQNSTGGLQPSVPQLPYIRNTGIEKEVPIPLLSGIPQYTGKLLLLINIPLFQGIPDNPGN